MSDPRHSDGYRVRTEVVFAAAAPIAVILRRGPRTHYQLMVWHLDRDEVTPGQWMRGLVRLFDVSPDGSKIIYWAAQHHPGARRRFSGQAGPYDPLRVGSVNSAKLKASRKVPRYLRDQAGARQVRKIDGTWTAISSPPYFSALAIWPAIGHWTGGGAFLSPREICLFESDEGLAPLQNVPLPACWKICKVSDDQWIRGASLYSGHHARLDGPEEHRQIVQYLRAAGARFVDWVDIPWPEQLDSGMAARFCGERSVPTFMRKVREGEYPRATRKSGRRHLWHVEALRSHIAKAHGAWHNPSSRDPVRELFG